jgi:hypothetical protein
MNVSLSIKNWRSLKFNLRNYLITISSIFLVLVFAGINFSNMNALSTNSKNMVGVSREIRSDEYLRSTPMTLASKNQKSNIAQYSQMSEGNSQNALKVYDVINFDQWIAKKLPNNQYYSYTFLSGIFILVIFLPLLLNRFGLPMNLGAIGALIIILSPGNVWWSFQVGTIIGRFSAFFYFALIALDAGKRKISRVAFSIASGWIFSTLFYFYQPWVIVCCILFAPLILSITLQNRLQWRYLLVILSSAAVLLSSALFANLSNYRIIRNAIYPGTREFSGGVSNVFDWMFTAPLNFALFLPGMTINSTNQSEISLGFAVLLFVGASLIILNTRFRFNSSAFLLLTGFLVIIFWTLLPVPAFPGNLLAFIPPQRALTFWTTASPLVLLFALAEKTVSSQSNKLNQAHENFELIKIVKRFGIVISLTVGILTLTSSIYLRSYVVPSSNIWNIPVSIIVTLSVWCILVQRRYLKGLVIFLLIAGMNSLPVNPLVRSTDQYFKNELSNIITKQPSNTVWVSNSMYIDAYLIANGTPSLSGQQFYGPKITAWRILDPLEESKKYWNRGAAYVVFSFKSELSSPVISAPNTDTIVVEIDPCSELLNKLRANRLASTTSLDSAPCLKLIDRTSSPFPLYIYERV